MIDLKAKAKQLRNDVLDMCVKAGTGHVSSCFSCVEIMTTLFYVTMRPQDKFILSKGHASPLLYAILADKGIIPKEWLNDFCQPEGRLGVHSSHHVPGVLTTSGSLGMGLGIGIGMAIANPDSNIYVLMGDAECQEGSVWEAVMYIGEHHINNIVAIIDHNKWGVMGSTMSLEKFYNTWTAFGWLAQVISDDQSIKHIEGFPTVYIVDTIKGKGISFMENHPEWHWLAPNGEQARIAKDEISA